MIRLFTLIMMGLVFFLSQASVAQNLQVVTSIQPLQLIANQVMQGSGQAQVLIDNSQSPHHFKLKPSQLRMLRDVDLLLWISNDFETGLNKLQAILPAGSSKLQLISHFATDQLITAGRHHVDGHLWLAPENVIIIARLIADKLAEMDPTRAGLYQRNAAALVSELLQWQQQARIRLDRIQPRYLLDHQFLNYFERSFALNPATSLRSQHDQAGSMRSLDRIHRQLPSTPAACLLVSSLPLSKQARQISQRYQLKVQLVNILNEDGAAETIMELLESIVSALETCG